MSDSNTRTLHTALIRRLALMVVLIALVLGSVAWFSERDLVGRQIVERAVFGVELFNLMIQEQFDAAPPFDRDRLQVEVDRLDVTPQSAYRLGEFVYFAVVDTAGDVLAVMTTPEWPRMDSVSAYAARRTDHLPDINHPLHEIVRLADYPHVAAVVPIHRSDGSLAAWGLAVFAPSEQAFTDVQNSVWLTVFWVVVIVLATTVLLYPVILRLLGRLARLSQDLQDANLETLQLLGSAIALRDSDTDAHNYRVTIFAVHLAEAAGVGRARIRGLIKGALLHDVGKIGIPDRVLLKPGKLTDAEYVEMKNHVRYGVDIVSRSAWLQDAEAVVRNHHEKLDGTGYDGGVTGGDIPLEARIFAIADVFDALTSRRPYKDPMTFDEAWSILEEGRASHFDADLLDHFHRVSPDLFERFANREGEEPRRALAQLVERYFPTSMEAALA